MKPVCPNCGYTYDHNAPARRLYKCPVCQEYFNVGDTSIPGEESIEPSHVIIDTPQTIEANEHVEHPPNDSRQGRIIGVKIRVGKIVCGLIFLMVALGCVYHAWSVSQKGGLKFRTSHGIGTLTDEESLKFLKDMSENGYPGLRNEYKKMGAAIADRQSKIAWSVVGAFGAGLGGIILLVMGVETRRQVLKDADAAAPIEVTKSEYPTTHNAHSSENYDQACAGQVLSTPAIPTGTRQPAPAVLETEASAPLHGLRITDEVTKPDFPTSHIVAIIALILIGLSLLWYVGQVLQFGFLFDQIDLIGGYFLLSGVALIVVLWKKADQVSKNGFLFLVCALTISATVLFLGKFLSTFDPFHRVNHKDPLAYLLRGLLLSAAATTLFALGPRRFFRFPKWLLILTCLVISGWLFVYACPSIVREWYGTRTDGGMLILPYRNPERGIQGFMLAASAVMFLITIIVGRVNYWITHVRSSRTQQSNEDINNETIG